MVTAGFRHVRSILREGEMRALYTSINNKYVYEPKMAIDYYDISVEQKQSDSVDTGLVISTTPEADAKAAEDTKITIYVSTGAGKVTVPNLVGKSQEEAERCIVRSWIEWKCFGRV